MGAVLSSAEGTLLVGVLLVGLYTAYRAALPKPLAGIPYNRDAARGVLGDVPEMMGYVVRTKRIFCWLTSLTERHQSPIIQAFVKPMSLPWVVVTDPFESQDILLRRTKEFDRSGFFGELIGGILPEQHIQFLSSDARFKDNRNLINHLMAPTFLARVSGPQIYQTASTMIRLWQLKCRRAEGRPFTAHKDVTYMALDTIFAAMFGHPEAESITIRRFEAVSQCSNLKIPEDPDQPVNFPDAEIPSIFSAALTLANSVTDTQLSPLPRLTSWILRQFPYMKNATAIKDAYIRSKIDATIPLLPSDSSSSSAPVPPKTALHSVLLREQTLAASHSRPPRYHSRAIADEFFGFMLAGHDTSATTLAWGLKYLSFHPEIQARLRTALRTALPTATSSRQTPTYQELTSVLTTAGGIPYLDAVVHEILRHANTIAFVVRRAQVDTTVLGRAVPRGTDVFLMGNGAGYLKGNMKVGEGVRSAGARRTHTNTDPDLGGGDTRKGLTGVWADEDISEFRPERWLRRVGGSDVFDGMAGPSLAFGLGPRGCFGRRFALLELRVQVALIVWHFELLETPAELSGMEAVQRFAREPTQCFVRLREASFE